MDRTNYRYTGNPKEQRPIGLGRRRMMRAGVLLVVVAVLVLAVGAGTAFAQATEFRMTGDLYLGPEETVDSLVTLNGDITVEGHVLDTVFTANGNVHVLPGGRVDGDAVSITGQVVIDEGGLVLGDRVELGGRAARIGDTRPVVVDRDIGFGGAGWFFWLLGGMGLGLLLVLLAANGLKSVGHEVSTRTARSALIGFLAPLGLLVLFVVLLISVIGIPVALLLIPLVPLTGMFGLFAIAMLAGRRLLDMAGKEELGDVWAMLAGVVLLNLVSLIPVVGALTWIVGGFVGFGATVARIWDHYQGRRAVRAAGRTNGVAVGPVPPMVPPPMGPPPGPMAPPTVPVPSEPVPPMAPQSGPMAPPPVVPPTVPVPPQSLAPQLNVPESAVPVSEPAPQPPAVPPAAPAAPPAGPTAPIEPVVSEAPVLPEAPIAPASSTLPEEPEARPRDPGPRFHI